MSEEEAVSEQSTVNNEQLSSSGEQLQGMDGTVVSPRAGEDARAPKTQGVRSTRADGGRRVLERAARAAAKTGRRGDVHEYMRLRRGYV